MQRESSTSVSDLILSAENQYFLIMLFNDLLIPCCLTLHALHLLSDQIRSDVGSVDWPMRHDGASSHSQLFLSEIHVLVPTLDGDWCRLPLVLLTHVSWSIKGFSMLTGFFIVSRTILQGKTSHKYIDMNENPIMHIYYTNRMVLGFMCLFNELFYATLYLLYFTPGPICKHFLQRVHYRFLVIMTFSFSPWSSSLQADGCYFSTGCNRQDFDISHSWNRRFSEHHYARYKGTWGCQENWRQQKERINFMVIKP